MTLAADDIAELGAALARSGLGELHLTGPGTNIRLVRSCDGVIDRVAPDCPVDVIVAPSVGIFLTHHPLHTTAVAEPGRRVGAGQTVALLRVGLLLLPVAAPTEGHIGAPLAGEGTMVGYGTTLFPLYREQPEVQR